MAKRGNPGLKGKLLAKSQDAFVLALELINRLSAKYRVETFLFLLCNAWELLLKARILATDRKHQAIYYPRGGDRPRRSLSLRDALKRVFTDERDPIRRNVEFLADLRDQSMHLAVESLPDELMELLQASVLNYHACLQRWFGRSLGDQLPVGMMTVVYAMPGPQVDYTDAKVRRSLGRETAECLAQMQKRVVDEKVALGSQQFAISITYHLALVKKADDADILLTTGPGGDLTQAIEVPKDPSKTHPFRQTEVVAEMARRLPNLTINRYDVQAVVAVNGVRQRTEWFYQGSVKGSPMQYSPAFIDWLVEKGTLDPTFLSKTRAAYRGLQATDSDNAS